MKKLLLLPGILFTMLSAHAQVTPYTGGNGSGYITAASPPVTCTFYYGGISDGTSANVTPAAICPLYSGGEGDGYSLYNNGCSAALPVTLIVFYGEKEINRNVLHWKLSRETNAKQIDVEKSADGINFIQIGTVPGSTSNDHLYLFIDHQAYEDINFYRLRITDRDGKISYSRILVMKNFHSVFIRVYPNPARSAATLYYETLQPGNMQLGIYQSDGRPISFTYVQIIKGSNYITLDLKNLSTGLYFITIGQSTARIKLMVLKK